MTLGVTGVHNIPLLPPFSSLHITQLCHSSSFPSTVPKHSWVPWEAGSSARAPDPALHPCYCRSRGLTPRHRLPRSKKTHLSHTSLMGAGFALAACLAFPKTQLTEAKLSLLHPRESGRAACAQELRSKGPWTVSHVKPGEPCSEQKGTPDPRFLPKNSSPGAAGLGSYGVCSVFPADLRQTLLFVPGPSTDGS